jgi:twitching motility protein PilT
MTPEKRETRKAPDSRLGTIAIERGALTREELDRLVARHAHEAPAKARERRTAERAAKIGELLVRERLISLDLLHELLDEQARRRKPEAPTSRGAERARAVGAALVDALSELRARRGTELLVISGRPRAFRVHGALIPLDEPVVPKEAVLGLAADIFSPEERAAALEGKTRTRLVESSAGRFRAVLSLADDGPSLAFRALNLDLAVHAERLPEELLSLGDLKRGLVVIAGGHGATRSTVLAQLVDRINATTRRHVITIERQVSFQHESRLSLVEQREVGAHTRDYATALRSSLREDPDVLVVGDLWEPEAVAMALLAAETGHLVISALHATSPVQAIRRLVDVQGDQRRSLVRATLANTLQAAAVVDVLAGRDGERFIVADIVPGTPSITRLIRDDRLHQIDTISGAASGITSRDERIVKLYQAGRLSRAVALERMVDPARLDGIAGPD